MTRPATRDQADEAKRANDRLDELEERQRREREVVWEIDLFAERELHLPGGVILPIREFVLRHCGTR